MRARHIPIYGGGGPPVTDLRWDRFQEHFLRNHTQGEHVSIVGPTGKGKTTMGLEVCKLVGSRIGEDNRPSRVTIIGTKPKDDTLSSLIAEGHWKQVRKWPPGYGEEHCIVWPRGGPPEEEARRQREILGPLVDRIYQEGRQAVFCDEEHVLELRPPEGLGLGPKMNKIWIGSRSNHLTMIGATQRPRGVTRSMWSEPAWVIIFPPDDEDDLKRVAEAAGNKHEVIWACSTLGEWEFLCVNRMRKGTKQLIRSRVEL